ncbi:MAG TPA: LPS export ABC transporter permease LptG [Deltaproteobacteria bacterium]|nr:LPS export ABC transporter permease LptG [Deltaproteobacteria bacterium]
MRVVTRYLLKEFLRMAAACLGAVLVLFLVIDFVDRADEFFRHQASVGEILRYYLYGAPNIFLMISPVAVLLAVLITVSLRARANEFTALFSGGISLLRAVAPMILCCALLAGATLSAQESLVPWANRKAREIARLRVRPGKIDAQFSLNRYWVRGPGGILSAQVVDPQGRKLSGFQYFELDGRFRPVRRVDARTAIFLEGGAWELGEGSERIFAGDAEAKPFRIQRFDFPETMQAFLDGETPPGEMTYFQLSDYVRDSRERGYDVHRYEVDLHAKLSYPLLNVIVSLLAVPVALRSPRKGGVWRSIGAGLLIGFLCWVALSTSLALGNKGLLPPLLAAWLPGALFAATGALLLRGTPR